MSINRVVIVGHLGSKPELKTSANGRPFTNLNVATTRAVTSSGDKEFKTMTDWHSVIVWGKRGESCAEYLVKGQLVAIEGYLSTFSSTKSQETNTTQAAQNRIGITAKSVEFLSKPSAISKLTDRWNS